LIYTVTLNPALDYVVCLEELTAGAVNRASSEEVQFGGKGINVSLVLHNLGFDSQALGFVAGFTGKALENALTDRGIGHDFVRLSSGMTRINVKIKAGRETEINGRGPEIPEADLQALFDRLDRLTAGDTLVLSGSVPASLPSDIYQQIMVRLAERKIRIIVDTTGDLLLKVLPWHPFLIKPNHHELGELFGRVLADEGEIAACAGKLQEQGARNVLVSMAGEGSLLLDEDGGIHRLKAPAGQVRNSVGAGDSMVAGFLAGYLRHGDYQEALELGTAAGSASAFSMELATNEEIQHILSMIKGRM